LTALARILALNVLGVQKRKKKEHKRVTALSVIDENPVRTEYCVKTDRQIDTY